MDKLGDIFFHYDVSPTTWFYLSALMITGIFFKFYRVLSVRNMDIAALLFFGPSMLLMMFGYVQAGYIIMFCMTLFYAIRLLLDGLMVRRPLLEPNLDSSGMRFTCISLLIFLAGSIAISVCPLEIKPGSELMTQQPLSLENALRISQIKNQQELTDSAQRGPGYPWFHEFALTPLSSAAPVPEVKEPSQVENNTHGSDAADNFASLSPTLNPTPSSLSSTTALNLNESHVYWTKILAIMGHILIVTGIIAVGYFHFGNFDTGVSAAVLYLLLPYSYQFATRLDHIIPAAFLIWALVFYRRPWVSGFLIGMASTLVYYPWFLLPLWISFYWRRGAVRFTMSAIITMLIMGLTILVFSQSRESCVDNIVNMMGCVGMFWHRPQGFWDVAVSDIAYRIPVLAAYCALCFSLIFWPSQKNLGVLLSCSAAVLLGSQLCHPYQGGLYMAWYLPFLILTIFRPNLEDRVAASSVYESRFRIIPRYSKE